MLRALRNIADSYAFQLRLRGDLAPRLAYATGYWARYLRARRRAGLDPQRAHGAALAELGARGRSARTVVVRTPEGLRLEVDQMTAFMVLRELYGERVYERSRLDDFRPRAGDVVFDVGSQQGGFALEAARRAGPSGLVVAIEPEQRNRALLLGNVARNRCSNVRVLDCAISDASGEARLFLNPENTGAHSLVSSGEQARSVPVLRRTLDQLSSETGRDPTLLKIDVEGSALAVLRGARGTLARSRPRIVLELDAPGDREAAEALLRPLGYRLETVGNNLFASAGGR